MIWILTIGGLVGAWVVLLLLSAERSRRLHALEQVELRRRIELEKQRKREAAIPTAAEIG